MSRVLFLAGLGRSGSTLFERIIGEVPGVCSLGEVVHLWERALRDDQLCGCGEPFSACPFWTAVGQRGFGGWANLDASEVLALKHRVDRTRYVPRLALPRLTRRHRQDLVDYLDLYERLYQAAGEVAGARVVVDSSKHASLAYCLRHSTGPDLDLLHVVRDSPGVAHSWSRVVERPEIVDRVEHMPRYSTMRVVVWWSLYNAMLLAWRRPGSAATLIRYEDFIADPRGTVQHVLDRVGLTSDLSEVFVADREVRLTAQHQVAGNPMRFRRGDVALVRDDAWRTQMSRPRRLLVELLTTPVRALMGYAGRGSPSRLTRRTYR